MTVGVIKNPSSTTLTADKSSIVTPDGVQYTATVTGATTGTVDFGISGCTAVALDHGIATCSLFIIAGSDVTVTATYSGDDRTAGSQSEPFVVHVSQRSTTALTSSVGTAGVGDPVTYTATVNSSVPLTGTVDFTDGSTTVCARVPLTTAAPFTASCPQHYATPGSQTIIASYSGDSAVAHSASGPVTVTIAKAATTTTIKASSSAPVVGTQVIYTATVSGPLPPHGSLTFSEDGQAVCSNVGLIGTAPYTATCTRTYPVAGPHSTVAAYSGDSTTEASQSGAVAITVGKASASINLATSGPNAQFGQTETFTAVLTGAGPVPTGTVSFTVDGNPLGAPVTVTSGKAVSATASGLAYGTHQIVASYAGDAGHLSAVQTLNHTIGCGQVVTGNTGQNLSVTGSVCLTSTAVVTGTITIKPGGALDVEGATIKNAISSSGAAAVRICRAKLTAATSISGTTGALIIGAASGTGCAADQFSASLTSPATVDPPWSVATRCPAR
ncbi:MAG: Ig-like domain repeat protein [Actinobacteria bacterium]|nr:Ig-like domain repeat protein [Actinomycetota bacterium]